MHETVAPDIETAGASSRLFKGGCLHFCVMLCKEPMHLESQLQFTNLALIQNAKV